MRIVNLTLCQETYTAWQSTYLLGPIEDPELMEWLTEGLYDHWDNLGPIAIRLPGPLELKIKNKEPFDQCEVSLSGPVIGLIP